MTTVLLLVSGTAIVAGLAAASFIVASRPPPRPLQLGRRGLKRKQTIRQHFWFRCADLPLRWVGGWLAPFVPARATRHIERRLRTAGYPLGLSPEEFIASSLALACGSFACAAAFASGIRASLGLGVLAAIAGACVPAFRLSAARARRLKQITRSMPSVLELVVLCLSAGLDLPRALRCVVGSATNPSDPMVEEVAVVVRELELGRTRREALLGFADRAPAVEVRELVNSVIQSEEKGVSLSKALTVQSRTLKLRRSMSAEQAASGAALMLVGPMSLIFLCVIGLLLVPVLIRTAFGGLGS